MRSKIERDLNSFDNVGQMLDYLLSTYDLYNTRPGFATKTILINGLIQAINLLKPSEIEKK